MPDILAELATVQMHAIQTSGNCIRNITTDHFAGVAPDEITDPLVWAELMRQWSTFHPEFAFLPRKFKIAHQRLARRPRRRAGARHRPAGASRNEAGETGFRVLVGGGLGRTPMIGHVISEFVPGRTCSPTSKRSCASTTATAGATTSTRRASRSWSRTARRPVSPREVEAEWAHLRDGPEHRHRGGARAHRAAASPGRPTARCRQPTPTSTRCAPREPAFARWLERNVHRAQGAGLLPASRCR